jgi:hypothetical protein
VSSTTHRTSRARNLGGDQAQGGIRRGTLAKPQFPWAGFSQRAVPLEGRADSSETAGTSGGDRRRKRRTACGRMKASKGEPQGRVRDEISPIGRAGSKASRGCETLRAQHNQRIGNSLEVCGSARLEKRRRGSNLERGVRRVCGPGNWSGNPDACGGTKVRL